MISHRKNLNLVDGYNTEIEQVDPKQSKNPRADQNPLKQKDGQHITLIGSCFEELSLLSLCNNWCQRPLSSPSVLNTTVITFIE